MSIPTTTKNPFLQAEAVPEKSGRKSKNVRRNVVGDKSPKQSAKAQAKKRRKTGTDRAGLTGWKAAPKSTRDVLGFQAMLPTGTAYLGGGEWSMMLRISDINYIAAAEAAQETILDRWAQLLNSFGAGTRVQETIVNRVLDDADVAAMIQKRPTGDGFDHYRHDANRITREKLAAASGNTVTEKYLTVTVEEPDEAKAEATLTRMHHEVEAQLSGMDGCTVFRLSRAERLEAFARILRPHERFMFDEEEFTRRKRQACADFVAPWEIDSKSKRGPLIFRNGAGETFHQVLWMRDYPVWLSDRLIAELAEVKCDLTVSLHLEPFDQVEGMRLVQRQIAELEMQKITVQKRLQKHGLEKDMLPLGLRDSLEEAHGLRDELRGSNQKLFSTVMVVGVSATSAEKLDVQVSRVLQTIRKLSCTAEIASYMQLDALTTELPSGRRAIPMRRTLTTASAAIIVPFTTQELFVPGGVWYGINAESSNALVADRTKTTNGNGFFLGTSGSGKSQFGKSEIMDVFLTRPTDDIIIIDPDREYEPLVQALGGETVRIHEGSTERVNPLDIELATIAGEDPIKAKCGFVLDLLETLVGGREGLSPEARSVADRVTLDLYQRYAAAAGQMEMPTLHDLRAGLHGTGTEGAQLARALEIYTQGSLAGFSGRTTVNTSARIMSWDISQLGSQMRTFGMMCILDQVWNRVARNRSERRRTWLYVDEFHLLFDNPYSSAYFKALYKRARKWGVIPTGITQNIEELLAKENARLMLANCDFLALLGQNATDADSLCDLLHFSDTQRRAFTAVQPGQGLLRSGTAVIPFDARIPQDSELYRLFSTTFGEA